MPSEIYALTWGAVDLQAGRFMIRSPRTERYKGKGGVCVQSSRNFAPILRKRYWPLWMAPAGLQEIAMLLNGID